MIRCTPHFFFFNDTATTEIYTLSLHDALPISMVSRWSRETSTATESWTWPSLPPAPTVKAACRSRSEEHTSELQSQSNLVCRLLLEKKKIIRQRFCRFSGNEDKPTTKYIRDSG